MPKNVNLNHFSMWRSGKKIVGFSPNVKGLLKMKGKGERKRNKFDTNKDASNKCENERIFLNLLEFT